MLEKLRSFDFYICVFESWNIYGPNDYIPNITCIMPLLGFSGLVNTEWDSDT